MKIHTNTIDNWVAISDALNEQKQLGRIASHVTFKTMERRGSRSHRFAFEIQLEAAVRDNGRRAGNSGSYGSMRPDVDGYAATYDEWGWLLAALYKLDSMMVVGTVKYPVYRHAIDFHIQTALTYNPEELLSILEDEEDPYPMVTGRAASAKRGYLIGRRGADRTAEGGRGWDLKWMPRSAEEVRTFAYPLEVKA